MGRFLNSIIPFERFKDIVRSRFFVDKTALIDEVISSIAVDSQRYLCITRPRRFGKTVMADMIGAFFGKASEDKTLFDGLKIAESEYYREYLNKWDVIYIDFSRMPRDCGGYGQYIGRIQDGINEELIEAFSQQMIDIQGAVWDNLQLVFEHTKNRFVFVIDEWDAIFHKDFITEEDKKIIWDFCVIC